MIPSKCFEPDKYWQIEHTGRFNPKVSNQTRTNKLNIQGDFIQNCVPDIKYWQVEHTGWFNTKVLNQTWSTDKLNIQGCSIQKFWTRHEVLTSWTYKIPFKILNQTWSTDKLNIQGDSIQNFWTKHEVEKLNIQGVSILSFEPDMNNRQFEHTGWFHPKVLNQIWRTNKLNIQGDSIHKFWAWHQVRTN